MTGSSLPIGYRKGVLQREQAAEYLGVSPSLFDEMVGDGRMPKAVVLSERRYGWV
jgi:predicted DNA-binding transcriptional regulator AlpA